MQSVFARHSIPETVVSDNGPQYSSEIFSQFANEYGFRHITSSPHYPQANGEAERAVKTIKCLLGKAVDPYLALLAYCSTPTAVGYTPSELLMNRKLRTTVPISRNLRMPTVPDYSAVAEKDRREKEKQAGNFNARHAAKELPTLLPGDTVYMTDRERAGTVLSETTPRSYLVQTPEGAFRRNRSQVIQMPQSDPEAEPHQSVSDSDNVDNRSTPVPTELSEGQKTYPTRLRSGKSLRPPERFDSSWYNPEKGRCGDM